MTYYFLTKIFLKISPSAFTWGFGQDLFVVFLAPFILGLVVTIIVQNHKGIVTGCITYLLYLVLTLLQIVIVQYQFFSGEALHNIMIGFLFIGVPGVISAGLGGLAGDYVNRRRGHEKINAI
jgi:hypothetical protein